MDPIIALWYTKISMAIARPAWQDPRTPFKYPAGAAPPTGPPWGLRGALRGMPADIAPRPPRTPFKYIPRTSRRDSAGPC